MKSEPLKGKRVQCEEYLNADCFDYKDIKSAVEWFLEWHGAPITFLQIHPQYEEELNNKVLEDNWITQLEHHIAGHHTIIHDFNRWLINKAFEDVIEKN